MKNLCKFNDIFGDIKHMSYRTITINFHFEPYFNSGDLSRFWLSWWRLFQKRAMCTKFDIYVFTNYIIYIFIHFFFDLTKWYRCCQSLD